MLDIEKLELINILEGPASVHGSFTCRPSHVLVFKRSGQSVYRFPGKSYTLSAGEAMFIPQGANYTFSKTSAEESRYILINFHGQVSDPRPRLFQFSGHLDFDRFCYHLHKAGIGDTIGDRYRAYRLFYQALEVLCEAERWDKLQTHGSRLLEPAIEYLQSCLFDPALKISALHSLCGISDTYFRRLFIARFGISPKQYVLRKRLQQAKAILEHGEYNTITQVAQLSGFDDPLYFSRLFRQTYGYPPSRNRE